MEQQTINYCEVCATGIIGSWKGWPHKQAIPILPKIEGESCPSCDGAKSIVNKRITWFNYHSEYSTGLPDYWLLEVDGSRKKWGHPYYGECKCPKCGKASILSEMKFPNGKQEFKSNCPQCGVRNIPKALG